MSDSIIPREIESFDPFIRTTNAYLLLSTTNAAGVSTQNSTRFGFGALSYNSTTATILQAYQAYLAQWILLFPKWQDKKGQRNTAITDALHLIIDALIADDKTGNKYILKIKSINGLTALDCTTFNIPVKLASPLTGGGSHIHAASTPSNERSIPSNEQVFVKLIPVGGNQIKSKCYKKSTDKRAGKPAGFDLVEYVAAVLPNVLPTGTLLPTDATDPRLTLTGHSSKANFLLNSGAGNAGKTYIGFYRWAKSKHPNLDGPWSGPFSTTIL